jgi:hypothetical protein
MSDNSEELKQARQMQRLSMELAEQYYKERDFARRWVCRLLAVMSAGEAMVQGKSCRTGKSFAKRLGWDCFEQSKEVQELAPEADSADTP